jgi:aspartate aminotransferase-like enzyme
MSHRRPKLFTPGPVEIPPEFGIEARRVVHHRSGLFRAEFSRVRQRLKQLFRTEGDVTVLASSGSGAMEAAVANLVSEGDRVLVVRSGKYGARWGELCRTYRAAVEWLELVPGAAVDPEDVERRMDQGGFSVIFLVHVETSTGVLNDVEAVSRAVDRRAAVVVDVISSLGAHSFEMDAWSVDMAVGASQKALALPPGLGFVAVGPRAIPRIETSRSPRYYFDLRKYLSAGVRDETPFTAPVTLIGALDVALGKMEPLERNIARHARLAKAARAGVRALGLEIFPAVPSDALTVFRVPTRLDAERLVQTLEEEYGVRIAHGQGDLRGRILRLGHLGWMEEEDLEQLFGALERGLVRCGFESEGGRGVGAVRSSLADS